MTFTNTAPELQPLVDGADHVDVKTAESDVTLREAVAAAIGWEPWWLRALFGARTVFARMLRLQADDDKISEKIRPEDLSFEPGGELAFFTVTGGDEDRFISMEAVDRHLTGTLAVVATPLDGDRKRFDLVTIVKYHRSVGRFYFNAIRPFHHVIVSSMLKSAVRRPRASAPR